MTERAFISRFSPNRTDPKVLEAIFVQRHKLAEVWLGRILESVQSRTKHHLLAVGPRGCGKSHLVSILVHRLQQDKAAMDRVRIARLPEDEATTSFWKFLLRIIRALQAAYPNEFPSPPRETLDDQPDDRRALVLTTYLREKLNGQTLLVVVENLDDVMRGLKDEGQKRWRSFLQESPVAATLATAQQITEDISDRDRPFFNFFEIEHLKPLTADEALALLRKIAEHTNNPELAAFLQTPTGRARVRAIRHITGGGHRVFIILSEFVTREKLDSLVGAFEELLDELTPYYQERLRWLPDQQREIIEFLCRQTRTVQVKEIASELFLSEQAAAAQLKSLRDKGYVTVGTVGRESRYELAEPLMRLCVEVKDPQREPIRLIVDFLRIWYDRAGVEAHLQCLPTDADTERQYFQAALEAHRPELPSLIDEAFDRDLEAARASGDAVTEVRLLVDQACTTGSVDKCKVLARQLGVLGRFAEALVAFERTIKLDPNDVYAWTSKGYILGKLDRATEALHDIERAIELNPTYAPAWIFKGDTLHRLDRDKEALAAFERGVELGSNHAFAWAGMGKILIKFDRNEEALAIYERVIALNPKSASAWRSKGDILRKLNRNLDALIAVERAIALDPNYVSAWSGKGRILLLLDRNEEALAAFERAIEIDPKQASMWNALGLVRLILGQVDSAVSDFLHAHELSSQDTVNYTALAAAHVLQGDWTKAEQRLIDRFNLSPSSDFAEPLLMADFITTLFQASAGHMVWAYRVGRLAEIASEAGALAQVSDALVKSLSCQAYTEAPEETLEAWAKLWTDTALHYPDLSLASRLFTAGVRYIRTKDERVFLDLLQEERSILLNLFGLDKSEIRE